MRPADTNSSFFIRHVLGRGTLPSVRNRVDSVNRAKLCNRLLLARRWPQDRELVGDLEAPRTEAEHRRRPAAAAAGGASLTGCFDHPAAQEHTLQARRRDVVPEGGGVELSELGDRELGGREREADVRVRELRAQALATRKGDLPVV